MIEGDQPFSLRRCDPRQERAVLVDAVAALQDFERSVEPRLPEGAAVAARYVDAMVQRCMAFRGAIFLAERKGGWRGSVACWPGSSIAPSRMDSAPTPASGSSLFTRLPRPGAARALMSVARPLPGMAAVPPAGPSGESRGQLRGTVHLRTAWVSAPPS